MHIFCDESGGTDPANHVFLVAAIAIDPSVARRSIKALSKALRVRGEIKGHDLSLPQRSIFFDILGRCLDVSMTVIVCGRADGVGAWAMAALDEAVVYGALVEEACSALRVPTDGRVSVTLDGGRYPKGKAEAVRRVLTEQIGIARSGCRLNVSYADSATVSGIQVADIIANSVYQSLGRSAIAPHVMDLMRPLIDAGRLTIRSAELIRLRPGWLGPS